MNLITRFQAWRRRWRRKQASRNSDELLREFVYLDEVSVYSLMASLLGPIATEFTETETASLQSEIGGSLGANLGVANGEVTSQVSSMQGSGSQVLRKSIVQTTFKELYDREADSLAMRPVPGDLEPPELHSLADLIAATKDPGNLAWIVNPERLARGQLLEVEVQLEADSIFRFSAAVSAVLEIFDENPEMFGTESYNVLTQAKSIDRILAKLLVGLVPVRGYAVEYKVVKLGEKDWIIHNKLLDQLPTSEVPPTHSLYVVGVAEQALFWKDLRRVLFSKLRFRVLCRVTQNSIQDTWTPVKLVHILESVAPDIANQINAIGSGALAAMAIGATNQNLDTKQQLMHQALVGYAKLLADHYGHSITEEELTEADLPTGEQCRSFGNLKERRKAFDAISTFVLARFDLKREPLIVAQYRAFALTDVGLHLSGQLLPLETPDKTPAPRPDDERFLDSEIVAIYW